MSETQSKNFENTDLISLVSIVEESSFSTRDEIERGKKIYKDRRRLKVQKESEIIKPLYNKKGKECRTKLPYYYKLVCGERCSKHFYKKCKHTGRCILDRDILTRQEHDIFLSQPKIVPKPKQSFRYCSYVKKYFTPCTYRIEQLALPKKQKLAELWNEYGNKMSPEKSENLARLLTGTNFTSIERAIELCNDEKKKEIFERKKILKASQRIHSKIKKQKMAMVRKISMNIFKAMREFLMSEQDLGFNKNAKVLSDVIARRIFVFGGYDTVTRNSDDVLARCVHSLSDSLSVWMLKITDVCSFGPVVDHSSRKPTSASTCPCNSQRKHTEYPIDDYIEYEPTLSHSESEYESSYNLGQEAVSYEGFSEMDEFSDEMDAEFMTSALDKTKRADKSSLDTIGKMTTAELTADPFGAAALPAETPEQAAENTEPAETAAPSEGMAETGPTEAAEGAPPEGTAETGPTEAAEGEPPEGTAETGPTEAAEGAPSVDERILPSPEP